MKNAKQNSIATVTKTITSQGATVKTVSTKAPECSLTNEEVLSMGVDSATAYLGVQSSFEMLNKVIDNAHKAGLKLVDLRGKNKATPEGKRTQLFKSGFMDTLAGKVSTATAQSYYELVAGGINKGKALTSTNKKANKAGTTQAGKTATKAGKGKGKSTKATGKAVTFPELLLAVHNHTSFKTLSEPTRNEIIAKLEKAKLIEA